MSYIPKKVLFEQFPAAGIYGVSALEAFDLALDGELAAYYHIPAGFELEGVSGRSYGDYHGPLARLPVGKLEYLQAHGSMSFNRSRPFQAESFHGQNFGPPHEKTAIRQQFDLEEYFWLFLKDEELLEVTINRVIFMRDDLEKTASTRVTSGAMSEKPLHTSERKSVAQIMAALAAMARLDLSTPYAADETLRASAASHGLELPSSPETVVKYLKAAAGKTS